MSKTQIYVRINCTNPFQPQDAQKVPDRGVVLSDNTGTFGEGFAGMNVAASTCVINKARKYSNINLGPFWEEGRAFLCLITLQMKLIVEKISGELRKRDSAAVIFWRLRSKAQK